MDYPNGINRFPSEVSELLKIYVYRLIDPRNGETFYVGKGTRNRVFDHIHMEIDFDGDEVEVKLNRIRQIRLSGFEVAHVIHRHGVDDDDTAYQVEAALLDAYPGLTNHSEGRGSSDYGTSHALEIITRYSALVAETKHKAIIISLNESSLEKPSIYEAVRYAWRMDITRAKEAEIVIASYNGIIGGVYFPEKWLDATIINFPGREDRYGRIGFEGCDSQGLPI